MARTTGQRLDWLRGRALMLNLHVAISTFDLMLSHMFVMKQLGLANPLNLRQVVMTGVAAFSRHLALSLNDLGMAVKALHVEALHIGMIERQIGFGHHLIGNIVA